jgi:glycerol-3-phosphate dehydrogenase
VLEKVNGVLRRPVEKGEIRGVFAGLRPLVAAEGTADTTRLSREHRLFSPVPGLTAIAGGKYTTYRVMARDAVNLASRDLGSTALSATDRLPLVGAAPPNSTDPVRARHGACADEILALAQSDPELAAPLAAGAGYLIAEAVHAVTHQGALDLDDILSRRTRVSIEILDRGRAAAAAVAPLVALVLGWSEARTDEEVDRYVRLRDAEAAAETAPNDEDAAEAYKAVIEGRSVGRASLS